MENTKIFICKKEDNGKRLDIFLSERFNISRASIQKSIANGLVRVNDEVVTKKNFLLQDKMSIQSCLSAALDNELVRIKNHIEPQNIPLNIIYEDEELLVVNKPQKMVVHPATSHKEGTLANALMYHCSNKLSDINGFERPGIVHRIDKDTSGLLVVAKTNFTHLHLAKQLKDKTTKREYHAIVHGGFNFRDGINGSKIEKPIARHPKNRYKRAVVEGGKDAVTHFKLIKQYGQYSYIKLKLETGRTHQIRVHMNYIGHPVLCDELYGIKNEKIKHNGQILHAKTLGFVHPKTSEYMEFNCELPDYFVKILRKIKSLG